LQSVNNLTECLNSNHMRGTTTATDTAFATNWMTNPFLLNPYSTAPANSIYTLTPSAYERGDRLLVKSIHHKLDLINLSIAAAKVDIYYCLCTQRTGLSPATAWATALLENNYLQTTIASGPTNIANSPTAGTVNQTKLNQHPTNRTFVKTWKIIKHKSIILQGGDTIKTAQNVIVNKGFTRQDFEIYSDNEYIKGLSIVPLMIVNGSLIGMEADSAGAGSTATQVSYCSTKIGVITQDEVKFAALQPNRYQIKRYEIGTLQEATNTQTLINDVDVKVEGPTLA